MTFSPFQKLRIRIFSGSNPAAARRALSQSTKKPNALLVEVWVVVLQISSKTASTLFMELLNRANPVRLAVWLIPTARTLFNPETLRD
jgi:hypothetical protein